ncbi:MAG: hypothetical protein AB1797_13235 [bacterium]
MEDWLEEGEEVKEEISDEMIEQNIGHVISWWRKWRIALTNQRLLCHQRSLVESFTKMFNLEEIDSITMDKEIDYLRLGGGTLLILLALWRLPTFFHAIYLLLTGAHNLLRLLVVGILLSLTIGVGVIAIINSFNKRMRIKSYGQTTNIYVTGLEEWRLEDFMGDVRNSLNAAKERAKKLREKAEEEKGAEKKK